MALIAIGVYLEVEGEEPYKKRIGHFLTVVSAVGFIYSGWKIVGEPVFTRRQIEVALSSLGVLIVLVAPPGVGYYRFRTQRTKARVISRKLDLFEKQTLLHLPVAGTSDYQEQRRRLNTWAELEFRRLLENDIRHYFDWYFIHPRDQSIGEIEVKADEFISNLARGRAIRDAFNGQLKIEARIRFTLMLWFKRLWHSIIKDATK